jgi:hypothetical protein
MTTSFPESEDRAIAVAHAYNDAFVARDWAGQAAQLNYPHVRIASGRVLIIGSAAQYVAEAPEIAQRVVEAEWRRSTLDETVVIHSSPDKVHLAVQFTRFDGQGNRLATYRALWIVTCQDGHWGIQARSSYAP